MPGTPTYYARAVVNQMLSTAASLARFTYRRGVVPEFPDEQLRERFAYGYSLIYRILIGKRLIEDSSDEFD